MKLKSKCRIQTLELHVQQYKTNVARSVKVNCMRQIELQQKRETLGPVSVAILSYR